MNATRRNIALSAVTALRLRFYTKGTIAGTKKSKKSPLVDSLEIRLRTVGPITVADYMKECLTHPKHGYYMNNDVFGTKGDFITSPEISQVFGELLGVWVAVEWQKIKDSSHLTIIELGPGRGTLASDILRTISQFDFLKDKISYHLIDVSPKMREMQKETLCLDKNHSSSQCVPSKYGSTTVSWHRSVAEVPITGNCCFIAHEFFDAMPVHKFQKSSGGIFHEVLIDLATERDTHYLRYVLSPSPNANCRIFVKPDESRDHVEASPMSGMIIQEIGAKIEQNGGFALIADYGHDGEKSDTFRGFKSHKLHDPLESPGEADLTADVDFSFLRHCLTPLNVVMHGPIAQQRFLHNMGISTRLNALLKSAQATEKTRRDLLSSYKMLCNPDEMGERFKFVSIHPSSYKSVPAGFSELC